MFIKLTGYYGPVYLRSDQIRSVHKDRDGDTVIRFIRDDANVVCVRETPDEVFNVIRKSTEKNEINET